MSSIHNKILILCAVALLFSGGFSACSSRKPFAMKTENDSLSYAMGADIGKNILASAKIDINPSAFALAFSEYYAQKARFPKTFIEPFMQRFEAQVAKGAVKKTNPEGFIAEGGKDQLESPVDSFSYCLGLNGAIQLSEGGVTLNPDAVEAGIRDFAAGKVQMNDEQIGTKLMAMYQVLNQKQAEGYKRLKTENLEKSTAFLNENKSKAGVKVMPEGWQYREIKAGTGASPTIADSVTVNYRGYIPGGQEFDNSTAAGRPLTFPLAGMVKGWQLALPRMKEGAHWEIFLPPDLGYGEPGMGNVVGPNQVLIFDVELVKVVGK